VLHYTIIPECLFVT